MSKTRAREVGQAFLPFYYFLLVFQSAVRSLKKIQNKIQTKYKSPLPPFRIIGTPKQKIFFSFLKKWRAVKK